MGLKECDVRENKIGEVRLLVLGWCVKEKCELIKVMMMMMTSRSSD